MSNIKAYLYSINPLDSASGKWDYGLLKQTFDRNHIEQITVKELPADERAFVVIPGPGNAGNEEKISAELNKISRVVLFINGDESATFNVDAITHPNIEIWIQYPHDKHKKYNKLALGVPQHLKQNIPTYQNKKCDVYFGGQITHNRRQELADAMMRLTSNKTGWQEYQENNGELPKILYRPTDGFAKGDTPKEYYKKMFISKIIPCPSGAEVIDSFRFYEAIEMLSLPIGDKLNSKMQETNFFSFVFGPEFPVEITDNWNNLPKIIPILLEDYPRNMHQVVCWWIKYKRDFSIKVMRQINAN